jgi:hypothetical protein
LGAGSARDQGQGCGPREGKFEQRHGMSFLRKASVFAFKHRGCLSLLGQ